MLYVMIENSLRDIRTTKEIPQNVLADAVEVSRQTIHAIESGKYIPSVELCLKIAQFLNLKVEDIFRLKMSK
jgi:putative transcriptional regulator